MSRYSELFHRNRKGMVWSGDDKKKVQTRTNKYSMHEKTFKKNIECIKIQNIGGFS